MTLPPDLRYQLIKKAAEAILYEHRQQRARAGIPEPDSPIEELLARNEAAAVIDALQIEYRHQNTDTTIGDEWLEPLFTLGALSDLDECSGAMGTIFDPGRCAEVVPEDLHYEVTDIEGHREGLGLRRLWDLYRRFRRGG